WRRGGRRPGDRVPRARRGSTRIPPSGRGDPGTDGWGRAGVRPRGRLPRLRGGAASPPRATPPSRRPGLPRRRPERKPEAAWKFAPRDASGCLHFLSVPGPEDARQVGGVVELQRVLGLVAA